MSNRPQRTNRIKVRVEFPNGYTRRIQYNPSTGLCHWVTKPNGVFRHIAGYVNSEGIFTPFKAEDAAYVRNYRPLRQSYQEKIEYLTFRGKSFDMKMEK